MNGVPVKYSVIIPIYNAEKTLARCVESLLQESRDDIELILINDGSTDRSEEICRKYQADFSTVRFLSQPNRGVSAARNAGLDMATGKFILFVDSDDYVTDHYFHALDGIPPQYELVMFSYQIVGGEKETEKRLKDFASTDLAETIEKISQELYRKTLTPLFAKRYSRSHIEKLHIRFPEDLYIGEDKTFNLLYATGCKSCCLSSHILYCVSVENQNSLSRARKADLPEQLDRLTQRTQQVLQNSALSEPRRRKLLEAENLIQLRGIYAEAKRMHLSAVPRAQRRAILNSRCKKMRAEHLPLPNCFLAHALKLPVYGRLIFLIDWMGKKLARSA